jgi:hypothetical protein
LIEKARSLRIPIELEKLRGVVFEQRGKVVKMVGLDETPLVSPCGREMANPKETHVEDLQENPFEIIWTIHAYVLQGIIVKLTRIIGSSATLFHSIGMSRMLL